MTKIAELFAEKYKRSPVAVSRAPGRLEILGNHTDYNEGFVLSAAVGQATEFAIAPVPGRICKLVDFRDGSERKFSLDDLDSKKSRDWANYVKGVIWALKQRKLECAAFEGAILSDIPLSAGMSSSAALEVASAYALAAAFGLELEKAQFARVGQCAENDYVGVNTGLLDQFSSIFGEKDALIYSDFRSNQVIETVALPEGCRILVANSMVKHNLVDSDYNARRESCARVAEYFHKYDRNIHTLRDVSLELLEDHRDELDITDYRRALHIVGENERTKLGVKYLKEGNVNAFGRLLFESHRSSRCNFENSCPELDFLVEQAKSIPGCLGARLSGGGFGGISIHLLKSQDADVYRRRLERAFELHSGKKCETILCCIGAGASLEHI